MLTAALALPAVAAGSGLHGVVRKGPIRPVCQVDQPCTAPAAGVKLTFLRGGTSRTVVTDADGRYRVTLAPGSWAVHISGARFGYKPTAVVVPAGAAVLRNFSLDTGIR